MRRTAHGAAPAAVVDRVDLSGARHAGPRPWWRTALLTGLAILPCLGAPAAALAADEPPRVDVSRLLADPQQASYAEATAALQRLQKSVADTEKAVAKERKLGDLRARLGSFESSFAIARGRLEPSHAVERADNGLKSKLGLLLDGDLLHAGFQRTQTGASGWTSSHGISSSVHQRYQTVLKHEIGVGAGAGSLVPERSQRLETRQEAFTSWSHETSESETVSLGVNGGAVQDLLRPNPQTFVEAVQALGHELRPGALLGSRASITARAGEGVHAYTRSGVTEAYYEIEALLAMRYPMRSAEIGISLASKVSGNQENPARIFPDVGVTLSW